MSDLMMRDILATPVLAGRAKAPRVIVDSEYFVNESSSRINKNIITDRLRVQLNRDYSRDEMLRMRKNLEDAGIRHIKLNKVKEEKIDLESSARNSLSLYSPEDLFDQWIDHDKPKKLDVSLLKKLNREIIKGK